jgi:hypothetical protein
MTLVVIPVKTGIQIVDHSKFSGWQATTLRSVVRVGLRLCFAVAGMTFYFYLFILNRY